MPLLRFNLKASKFPLMSSFFGPSVAVRGNGDSDYIVTDAYSGTAANDEIGIAQPIYMHNVVPVSHGLQSVDYDTALDNSCAGQSGFDTLINLQDYNGMNHFLSPAGGQNFVSSDGESWSPTQLASAARLSGDVSFAHVRQQTYVCYRNQGVFKYDPISKTLQPVPLSGINTSEIAGITYAQGQLIAYTDSAIYYSSFENPEDFTPSRRTGAGSAQIVEVRGLIVACLPHTGGFMVYSEENAVYARSTSDLAYPFTYEEVHGSAGITSIHHVASDSTFSQHFAWTKAGLLSIAQSEARPRFPELTDFLTCGYLEDYINNFDGEERTGTEFGEQNSRVVHEKCYSPCPNNLIKIPYTNPLQIKVNVVATRYLAISYGIGRLTHALLFDMALNRMGKLRIPHVDIFNYTKPESAAFDSAKKNFGILQENGTIRVVNFQLHFPATDSVLMFGRLQLNRGLSTTLDTVKLAGFFSPDTPLALADNLTIDGMTALEDINLLPFSDSEQMKIYGARTTGSNHVLKISGTFSLTSIEADLQNGGNR